jgi:CHASE3 domain sensor protein
MTTAKDSAPTNVQHQPERTPANSRFTWFANLPIGLKLALGFGTLVILTFLGAAVSFISSNIATAQIGRTESVRVPTSLLASKAQAGLLRMQSDVRGYLALGDALYRQQFDEDRLAFEADLAELERLSPELGGVSQIHLQELRKYYDRWALLPEELFELRDDQLDREPAYRLLATDGILYAGQVLIATGELIDTQGNRPATAENLEVLEDMARFQGDFSAMLSALRGYVTTRNRIYRGEFEVNLASNNNSWERLQRASEKLTPSQRDLLDQIESNRSSFLSLPEQIFKILESERWREDLYLFQTQALPLAESMIEQLDLLTEDQQTRLRQDLGSGSQSLYTANRLILASGFIALLISLLMAGLSRTTIANPIRRLTGIAEQIRQGDLDARAAVESSDEIGLLGSTFNEMTSQLQSTLVQVRKEKKRADDLLEVVIPIGVELTTEKDFNRLLEKMLLEAKNFCKADTGILYLVSEENSLRYTIVRSDSKSVALGGTTGNTIAYQPISLLQSPEDDRTHIAVQTALNGSTINISSAEQYQLGYAITEQESQHFQPPLWQDYPVQTMLAIPLKNSDEKVLGVMQLINATDLESGQVNLFDANLQQMMESFSSLAVAALEAYIREQALRVEVAQLRIEIDKAKQQRQVEEIIDTDFFRELQTKAETMRQRRKK